MKLYLIRHPKDKGIEIATDIPDNYKGLREAYNSQGSELFNLSDYNYDIVASSTMKLRENEGTLVLDKGVYAVVAYYSDWYATSWIEEITRYDLPLHLVDLEYRSDKFMSILKVGVL